MFEHLQTSRNNLFSQIRHKYDKDIRKCLKYILSKGQLGDWFVLYQLCKNSNPFFFRDFVKELAIDLKKSPKKSRSTSKKESLPPTPSAPKRSSQEKRSHLVGDVDGDEIHL